MDTKFQKKYESDMTGKEKRELERKKLASLHGREKLEYILAYYKFHIAAIVIVICLIIGGIKWIDDLKDENYLYAAVINAPSEGGTLIEDFRNKLGDTDEHHVYLLDTSVFFAKNVKENEPTMDHVSQMKMSTLVGAGTADVFVCPKNVYEQYSKDGDVLYQISDIMGEAFVKEYADICLEDAIRVDDSKVLKKYGLDIGEPAYLIVFQYTKHPEIAKDFVRFVVE